MSMTPIPTDYKDIRFRSKLEAQWAVFFDACRIKWQYELQPFDLGGGLSYLPDFFLPELSTWLEVKPTAHLAGDDLAKAVGFQEALSLKNRGREWSHSDGGPPYEDYYILAGEPYATISPYHEYEFQYLAVPGRWYGAPKRNAVDDVASHWTHCPLCGRVDLVCGYCGFLSCQWCDVLDRRTEPGPRSVPGAYFHKGGVFCPLPYPYMSPQLVNAYRAARAAFRFTPNGGRHVRR